MTRSIIFLAAACLGVISFASAQSDDDDTAALPANDTLLTDTLSGDSLIDRRIKLDYVEPLYVHTSGDTLRRGPNPTVALFKSLFVPGWGQLSNRKYIKAGIVIAGEALLIGSLVHYAKKTSDARDAFDAAGDTALFSDYERQQLFDAYRDAEDDRNRFSWYLGTVIFLSMFDAFVDAHLADFPKKDNELSLRIRPEDYDAVSVKLTLIF